MVTASLTNLITNNSLYGFPLILALFTVSLISTIFLPGTISKWAIISPSIVPAFMNAGLSPEFATVIFRAGECATYVLTPIMAYFVIYLAFMELYSSKEEGLIGNIKYLIPYSFYTAVVWLIVIILFFLIGLPLGIGAYPGL